MSSKIPTRHVYRRSDAYLSMLSDYKISGLDIDKEEGAKLLFTRWKKAGWVKGDYPGRWYLLRLLRNAEASESAKLKRKGK